MRVVYSPLDAVNLAAAQSRAAGRVLRHRLRDDRAAKRHGGLAGEATRLTNFSVLVSHVLVPPAMTAILSPDNRVQGFLGPGHVCTVMGYDEYEPIARALSACRSSSPASSRSTCSKAFCRRCGSSKPAGPRSRTSTAGPSAARATRHRVR